MCNLICLYPIFMQISCYYLDSINFIIYRINIPASNDNTGYLENDCIVYMLYSNPLTKRLSTGTEVNIGVMEFCKYVPKFYKCKIVSRKTLIENCDKSIYNCEQNNKRRDLLY